LEADVALLEAKNIVAGYTKELDILKGISLAVEEDQVVSIIGPNGCGKSTTFRTLFGLLPAREGEVIFDGENVTNRPPADLLGRGITFVPQGRHVFPLMTVRENLELGAYIRRDRKQLQEDLDRVYALFPLLKERAKQKGGSLSGGEMQTLEMGRAMLLNPRLMFLDEPSLGLSPIMANQVFDKVEEIRDAGSTMLIVEQNADRSLQMSDYAYVFETGRNKYEGPAEEIRNNEEVKRLYLGG
jgi:ABC-type branched-subunit amino acid transport system ATPase component